MQKNYRKFIEIGVMILNKKDLTIISDKEYIQMLEKNFMKCIPH